MPNNTTKEHRYSPIILNASSILAENGIQIWLDFSEIIKPKIEEELKRFKDSVEVQFDISEVNNQGIEYFNYDDYRFIESSLAMLNNTVFSQMYSVFEYRFIWISKYLISIDLETEETGTLQYRDIKETKRHWQNYVSLEFPVSNPEWENFNDYRLLRNSIVHKDSKLLISDKYSRRLLNKFWGISDSDFPFSIEIPYALLKNAGDKYKRFFRNIRKSLAS